MYFIASRSNTKKENKKVTEIFFFFSAEIQLLPEQNMKNVNL